MTGAGGSAAPLAVVGFAAGALPPAAMLPFPATTSAPTFGVSGTNFHPPSAQTGSVKPNLLRD
jgi:hypothetical protein